MGDPCVVLPMELNVWVQVRVAPVPGKKFEHNGIRVQLIGQIELASERGSYYDFLSLSE